MKTCPTVLWFALANDLGLECSIDVSKDMNTLRRRFEHEGLSFLTITLPNFCSDLERCLELGFLDPSAFPGFRKSGKFPAFLQGFLRLVFSPTGELLKQPDAYAVRAIRQLTLLYKKVEIDCTPQRVEKAKRAYALCERELKATEPSSIPKEWTELSVTFDVLYSNILSRVATRIDNFQLSPKHGPGATADKKFGNQKWIQTTWTDRLERVFPFGEYCLSSWNHFSSNSPKWLRPSDELPVSVKFVPKTQKTPRVIAVEPVAMQYMQQALMAELVGALEDSDLTSPLIGFTDQTPNQIMAEIGSRTGHLATLDLSEASDRVRASLVFYLTRNYPSFQEGLFASRSRSANLDGRIIRLSKFASMGSATCFPVEAMVFLAIIVHSIALAQGLPHANQNVILDLHGAVRVYGDDLVVPSHFAADVMQCLESFHLKVNHSKSFISGQFRESCGSDFFCGVDVKPSRVKRLLSSRLSDDDVVATVALRNSLYLKGFWRAASHLDSVLERRSRYLVKIVPTHRGAVGLQSFLPSGEERFNDRLHVSEVKCLVARTPNPVNSLDDVWALRKCLSGDYSLPEYRDHLLRSGRPKSVNLKTSWVESSC